MPNTYQNSLPPAPTPPTSPASAGRSPGPEPSVAVGHVVDMIKIGLTLLAAMAVASMIVAFTVVRPWLDRFSEGQVAQLVEVQRQIEALDLVATRVDAMVPPNNDKLFTILSRGVGSTEYQLVNGVVGLVAAAAFITDLITVQQTDAYTQEFTIRNLEPAGGKNLCFAGIPWASAGATCTLKCAAFAGIGSTCTGGGTATDGFFLYPGQSVTRRFDGTSCLCTVGSAAGTVQQNERVIR